MRPFDTRVVRVRRAVTVYLQGGLGNQLFQLAAGWVAASRSKCPLILDLAFFDGGSFAARRPLHEVVDIAALPLDVEIVTKRLPAGVARIGTSFLWRTRQVNTLRKFIVSREIGFDDAPLARAMPGSRMWGYFQSELFVAEARRRGFPPQLPLKLTTQVPSGLLEALKCEPIVAIHVRGGDFHKHDGLQGTLPNHYYQRAMRIVESRQKVREVWIFGNDVEANLRVASALDYPWTPASCIFEDQQDIHDYLLMRNARSVILSNSTFGWWAARDDPTPACVTYPVPWNKHRSPSEIAPPSWIGTRV